MHKNALLTAGVQFDKDGNAVNPKVQYGGEAPAPAAAQTPRPRGGPMAKPASVAPAAPVLEFKTEAEVEAANLPKGTKIKVGGRLAEVQ